jgi:hypothetical protein
MCKSGISLANSVKIILIAIYIDKNFLTPKYPF